MLKRLSAAGIFVRPEVSLEHQNLAKRYAIRGVESGGAVEEVGRYVTFGDENGEPVAWLQPIDSLAVNGVHATSPTRGSGAPALTHLHGARRVPPPRPRELRLG